MGINPVIVVSFSVPSIPLCPRGCLVGNGMAQTPVPGFCVGLPAIWQCQDRLGLGYQSGWMMAQPASCSENKPGLGAFLSSAGVD